MKKLFSSRHLSKLWILIPVDLVVLWALVWWIVPDGQTLMDALSEAVVGVTFIIGIIALHIAAGIFLLIYKSKWTFPVLLNIIIAPFVFIQMFNYEVDQRTTLYDRMHYRNYYFSRDKKRYRVEMELDSGRLMDSKRYHVYEELQGGANGTQLDGKYFHAGDDIRLVPDSGAAPMIIRRDSLYGFDASPKPSALQREDVGH